MKACGERGQASVEYVGLATLLALAFSAALAIGPGPASTLPAALAQAICAAAGGDCTTAGEPELTAARERPPAPAPLTAFELVNRFMAADLRGFLAYRSSAARDPRLDYSTDLCSAPVVGSEGRTFDFSDPCIRHDFGYRNYSDLGRFRGRRRAVDDRFLADMKDHCRTRLPWDLARCGAWARSFYAGVRAFGWSAAG